jgi:hypothetical protein
MHRRFVAIALIAATALPACSDDGPGDQAAQTESDVPGGDEAAAEGDEAAGDGGPTTPADGDADDAEPIGTTRAHLRADAIDERTLPLRIDVVRLAGTGELVELELVLTNEATAGGDLPAFAANEMFGGGPGIDARYDISAVGLVDPDEQKMYLPVFDSEDECLCTGGLGATNVPAGESVTLTATYGGVPEDVGTLDLHVPQFPAVTRLRVAR